MNAHATDFDNHTPHLIVKLFYWLPMLLVLAAGE